MSDEAEDTSTATPTTRKPMPKVVVTNFVDGAQARKDASFSLADLSSAMQEQMGFRVHYGEVKAKAERQVNDLKIKLEAAESRVYRTVRDDLTKQSIKITEDLLKREVAAHNTILAIKLAINEAKQVFEISKGVYDAIDDRKSMLVSAGAKDRAEMEGEIRIRAAGARSDGIKNDAQEMLARRNNMAS